MLPGRQVRQQAQADIAELLSRQGPKADHRKLWYEKYPEVARATWFRWVAAVKKSGIPAMKTAARVKEKAAARKRSPKNKTAANDVIDMLPKVIRPQDVAGTGIIPGMAQIQTAIDAADSVKASCLTESGKIRKPKLFLAASNHMLVALRTAAYISGQLMEAQRIEKIHTEMFEAIRKVSPEAAEEILDAIEQINRQWGLQ